ncbi:uncharacterized protein LOC123300955 [Chrysoperla carnea]|uniref:uncharacterized protein LOC123300955 n=1 Tax=Chrysoperla carnea TaxID=189513 RepID=UPI001D063F41|nr:uncharacterized protein LOC123300955 [Chrysoperla carnea]
MMKVIILTIAALCVAWGYPRGQTEPGRPRPVPLLATPVTSTYSTEDNNSPISPAITTASPEPSVSTETTTTPNSTPNPTTNTTEHPRHSKSELLYGNFDIVKEQIEFKCHPDYPFRITYIPKKSESENTPTVKYETLNDELCVIDWKTDYITKQNACITGRHPLHLSEEVKFDTIKEQLCFKDFLKFPFELTYYPKFFDGGKNDAYVEYVIKNKSGTIRKLRRETLPDLK